MRVSERKDKEKRVEERKRLKRNRKEERTGEQDDRE